MGRLIQATGRAALTASTATQEAYKVHGGPGVFTFVLLDGWHVVSAITEKRWGARQFPQMDAHGSNFPLARQVVALASDLGQRDRHSDQAHACEH